VLEVGFGAGTDFIQWLRAGAVASGVDLTEEALANLTHRINVYGLPAPASIKVADAENLPFETGYFDLGYSWGVLHHTPNTEKAVRDLVRVVRPGGQLKLMLYNRRSLCSFHHWVKYALFRGRPGGERRHFIHDDFPISRFALAGHGAAKAGRGLVWGQDTEINLAFRCRHRERQERQDPEEKIAHVARG
jgi:SAM-dependent methyltransferase